MKCSRTDGGPTDSIVRYMLHFLILVPRTSEGKVIEHDELKCCHRSCIMDSTVDILTVFYILHAWVEG